ncbi:MAG TPA: hypothetical protein VGU44_02955, partial [Gammaproteobacteria bacterium]|nr:hypothetical protein [Gammaproteobacteria bacterium]
RMGGWAQKKFQHSSRNEQLNLLITCLNNLKDNEIDTQTTLITKGLMLAIKHQLDKEWFSANSKLKEKVEGILKNDIFTTDNDKTAIKAFQEYAHTNKGKDALNISTKMLGKIDTATQDYELGVVNRIRKG